MKEKFHGYYAPSQEEFDELWNSALIVLDANVLLNLYRYSTDTRGEMLDLFEGMQDRLWLPHQVAAEYHRNRCDTIDKELRRYDAVLKELQKAPDALRARTQHPFIDERLFNKFAAVTKEVQDTLKAGQEEHGALAQRDPIRERITELFDGKVGDALTEDELTAIHSEGKRRYARKIPPGYGDEKKDEPDRYGDLVIWKQTLRHAAQTGRSVVFVTDDTKDDWWLRSGSKKLGPHPLLGPVKIFVSADGLGLLR